MSKNYNKTAVINTRNIEYIETLRDGTMRLYFTSGADMLIEPQNASIIGVDWATVTRIYELYQSTGPL
jgi:hypothetical protein